MDEKEKALIELEIAIQKAYPNNKVWTFPSKIGVTGYRGTQNIIFLGWNPSTGEFWSKGSGDEFLYTELIKNGFENAHITDFFKLRMTNIEFAAKLKDDPNFCVEQAQILCEEIDLINPVIIVPMGGTGQDIYERLYKRFISRNCSNGYSAL